MATDLQSRGITATLVSRQRRLIEYAQKEGVEDIHKGWWWSRQNWSGKRIIFTPVYLTWVVLLFFWYLLLILRTKPNIVHILSKDDFIAATPAARLLGKPVFWTDCADLKYLYQNHKVWYKNPVGKLIYASAKLANAVTLVSNNEKSLIEQSLGGPVPKNHVVVHTGAKAQEATPIQRSDNDANAVIFCATSRLVVAKGIGELVDAFSVLSKDTDAYRLWIVGDGPDEAKFKEKANGNPYILFVGHSDTPLAYVAACDVFVHPTHHEGFSLSLSEAAMLGKPMIATNVGGNPELVNDQNGMLVPVQNADELMKAMRVLGTNEEARKRLGKSARDAYFSNFEFGHVMKEKIITLYEQATKN
jgi:glycosyltransferase involved in cell wall biosynthesis